MNVNIVTNVTRINARALMEKSMLIARGVFNERQATGINQRRNGND